MSGHVAASLVMSSPATHDESSTTATVVGRSGAGWQLILASGVRAYAPASALGPELRRLAPGQRVHLRLDAGGMARRVWL